MTGTDTPAQLDSTVARSGFPFTYWYGLSGSAVDVKAAQQYVARSSETEAVGQDKSGKRQFYHSFCTWVRTPIHILKM